MGLVLELWDNFEFFADVPTLGLATPTVRSRVKYRVRFRVGLVLVVNQAAVFIACGFYRWHPTHLPCHGIDIVIEAVCIGIAFAQAQAHSLTLV